MPAAEAPAGLRGQQLALTRHLRDPDRVAAPAGMEPRRLAVYRELLLDNLHGLLSGNFPVLASVLGAQRWRTLVGEFHRDHRCRTPLFPEIGREFLRYLESLPALDPPFLQELAHYEWVELALQIHEAEHPPPAAGAPEDATELLLETSPVLSPLAWPLAYRWPVHRIGPQFQPTEPPGAPTLLLLRRDRAGDVRFSELAPLAFRLVQRIEATPGDSARQHLLALAAQAGATDKEAFLAQGLALLRQLRQAGALLDAIPPSEPGAR